jgi:hypothetical protein
MLVPEIVEWEQASRQAVRKRATILMAAFV